MNNIGHILALLQNENKNTLKLTDKSVSEIQDLRDQINQKTQQGKLYLSWQKIPKHTCSESDIFLDENIDFFLSYLVYSNEEKNCMKLFSHLNKCYCCFNIFSQTMRDYFQKNQEIVESASGAAI